MSLIELIDKYKTYLAVSNAAKGQKQEIVERYRLFGQDLVNLPSFTYTGDSMKAAVKHMWDSGFSRNARYEVAVYAMRRASIDALPDLSARQEIWELLELAQLGIGEGGGPRIIKATEDYVIRVGKSQAEQELLTVRESSERVYAEVFRIVTKDDPIAEETVENHRQRITTERLQLEIILGIITSS